MIRPLLLLAALLALAACNEETSAERPGPVALTAEAAGHYCQMIVLDHAGPKAQVHLAGNPHPLWFSQVRDALAYDRMPEEDGEIVAIYVSDMGASGATWSAPGEGNWIALADAVFVVDSDARGGMGAPELVPFSDAEAAQAFAAERGGRVVDLAGISDEMVLSPVDVLAFPGQTPAERGAGG